MVVSRTQQGTSNGEHQLHYASPVIWWQKVNNSQLSNSHHCLFPAAFGFSISSLTIIKLIFLLLCKQYTLIKFRCLAFILCTHLKDAMLLWTKGLGGLPGIWRAGACSCALHTPLHAISVLLSSIFVLGHKFKKVQSVWEVAHGELHGPKAFCHATAAGPAGIATAEPSAQNIFPSHGSTLGAQLL